MSEDGIDASLGLAFSLELFKRYQKSGVLRAEIPRMSGIRGRCTAFITLVDGQIISVYLEDQRKQRYSSDTETLCQLDKEKGPFEWVLMPASTNTQSRLGSNTSSLDPLAPSLQRVSVPTVIAAFPWERIHGWTTQQKDALYALLMEINGARTIEQIKMRVHLPPYLVDELLRMLLDLNVIILTSAH